MYICYSDFSNAFDDAIVDMIHSRVHYIMVPGYSYINFADKPWNCAVCTPQVPCTRMWTKGACINMWAVSYVHVHSEKIVKISQAMYKIPEVHDHLPALIQVSQILGTEPPNSLLFPMLVKTLLRLTMMFPQMYGSTMKAYYKRAHSAIRVPTNSKSCELRSEASNNSNEFRIGMERLQKWEELICQAQTSGMWKEWEMNTSEFTSWIQWLPREMVEDVASLEGKTYFP